MVLQLVAHEDVDKMSRRLLLQTNQSNISKGLELCLQTPSFLITRQPLMYRQWEVHRSQWKVHLSQMKRDRTLTITLHHLKLELKIVVNNVSPRQVNTLEMRAFIADDLNRLPPLDPTLVEDVIQQGGRAAKSLFSTARSTAFKALDTLDQWWEGNDGVDEKSSFTTKRE